MSCDGGQSSAQPAPQRFSTFLALWATQVFAMAGSGITLFCVNAWLATALFPDEHQKADLAAALAAVNMAFLVASVFSAPLAGSITDRYDRRTVMMLSDIGNAVVNAAMAWAVLTGTGGLAAIVTLSALNAFVGSFHAAALDTAYATLVPKAQLPRANGMMQTAWYMRLLLGPPLGAVIFGMPQMLRDRGWTAMGLESQPDGAAFGIAIHAVIYLLAGLALLAIRIPSPEPERGQHRFWSDVSMGWTYIAARPSLFWLLACFTMANFVASLANVLSVLVVKFDTAADWAAQGLSFEDALARLGLATAVGGLAGGLAVSAWGGLKTRLARGLVVPMILAGAGLLAYAEGSFTVVLAGAASAALAVPFMNAHSQSIWQSVVPSDKQGRVFAIRRVVAQCSLPLGSLAGGLLGGVASAATLTAVAGAVLLAFGVLQWLNPVLMRVGTADPADIRRRVAL
ncbi:MAG TPA: MFS transporter [Azospirillaceae bacterium]|nr:MFS transporter [Azospirillaceae bacterium]